MKQSLVLIMLEGTIGPCCFFLKLRYDAGLEEVSAENWTLNCPPCARQSDGSSCGIYVLKFAENWLNGKSLLFRWNQMEIFSARKSLAIYMVSTAKNTEPSNINMTTKTNDKTQEDEVFCVCKEADNGKLYWQCIWCDEWFHPSCIKRDDVESSPNPFYCDECLDINLRSWDVINYFDDEDEDSETFAINSSAALSKMKDAYKICYKITTSTASKSKMEWLQSHLRFVDGKRILCNGYGFGVFTQQALFNVKRNLMKHFFEKKSCVSVQGTVPQMANEKMIRAFQEDGYLASEYVSNVLLEEALKKIMQLVFGISYKVSHGYLKITVSNSMNRSVNKALEIREKIKARIQRNK
ncbi:COMPASS (complex proteins associated with Set1p) component [Mactra antiquata]